MNAYKQAAKSKTVHFLIVVFFLVFGLRTIVADQINPGDPVTPFGPVTSNGATFVTMQAGTAGRFTYAGTISWLNSSAVTHTINIRSSGGTALLKVAVGPNNAFVLDSNNTVQSLLGEGLQYSIDTTFGATTDLQATGATCQK